MAKLIQGGTYGEGNEVLTRPRYDRFKLANGTLKHTIFDKKVGDDRNGTALTLADTNLEEAGSIPNVMKWEIWEVWLIWQAVAVHDEADAQAFMNMIRNTVFKLDVVAKFIMFDGSFDIFFGSNQSVITPAVAGDTNYPQSMASYTGKLILEVPWILEADTSFKIDIEHLVAPASNLDDDYMKMVWWNKELIGPPAARQ